MSEQRYKLKYEQLKHQYISSIDVTFRLGYEQGFKDAQMEGMQQQMQQQQMQQQAMQQGQVGPDGQPAEGQEGVEEQGDATQGPPQGQSELDSHIGQLESMIAKGELDQSSLKKAVDEMRQLIELQKAEKAIKKIGKAMKKTVLKLGVNAKANMPEETQKALSMQEQIVDDVFKSWDKKAPDTLAAILKKMGQEGLVKKE